jgi:uncharacterized membrane protein YqjE
VILTGAGGGNLMTKQNLIFLLISILTFSCIVLIGISIAEESILGAVLAILAVVALMGTGFTLKKKFRESQR